VKKAWTISALTALLCAAAPTAWGATVDELQQKVEELGKEVRTLKESGAAKSGTQEESYAKKVWDKTRFGGYGELDYVFRRENGNGQGGNTFEPRRFVLYVSSELADWVALNSELEWEHGGVPDGGPNAGVSVEQAFLDFKLARPFNVKAGVMLMPMGATNLYHEPTSFNATTRPEPDQIIIPTTWQEMGIGIHGALGEKTDYQLLVTTGLDGTKFNAESGIREGRQGFGKDSNRNMAVTGRLELRPLTNLYTNFSFYTGNSAPSGAATAYTTVAAFDGKYSIGDFDIAGEYAHVYQDNPAALGVTDIGHNMSGYWVEGAYHVMPKSLKKGKLADADALVFVRWSELNTQDGGALDPTTVSGKFDRNYTTFGVVFKPVTTVAIKADYLWYGDHRGAGEIPVKNDELVSNDKFQLSIGFVY
jgi:hypothetical protein